MNELINYYSQCVREEAKSSAFTNINGDKKAEIVDLYGNEVLFTNKQTKAVFPNCQSELINLSCKAKNDKEKELIYGYMFLTGTYNRKVINTPLFYSFANIEVNNGKAEVIIGEDIEVNVGTLMYLIEDEDIITPLTEMLLKGDIVPEHILPVIENTFENVDVFGNKPSAPIKLTRDKAVVLTKAPKDISGLLKDLDEIDMSQNSVLTHVSYVYDRDNTTFTTPDVISPINNSCFVNELSGSQREAVLAAEDNGITAVLGAPGTGKSHVIATIAADYVANGKSVLIASKMDGALEVIRNKMQSDRFTPIFSLITGNKERREEVAKYFTAFSNGLVRTKVFDIPYSKNELARKNCLEGDMIDLREETKTLKERLDKEHNIFKRFMLNIKKDNVNKSFIAVKRALDNMPATELLSQSYLKGTIQTMNTSASNDNDLRQALIRVAKTIKKGNNRSQSYKEDFEFILKSLIPCWLTTNNYVSASIPNVAGLFDVVIIDEASQCDIASTLPLLYRAKKAVIVGDNNQLKFITFMSNNKNTAFKAQYNVKPEHELALDYKENSLYDFATYMSTSKPYILKQQFRGNPLIMNFSNEKFYNNQVVNVKSSPSISTLSCQYVLKGKCSLDKTCNDEEAKAIIREIKIAMEQNKTLTFGIISPFKAQVELIQHYVDTNFTQDEIRYHKIRVGTAHAFQGDERDVMLISWTVDANSHRQSYSFLENPNLFNVTITRAEFICKSFISTPINQLPNGLLKEYMEYIGTNGKRC